MAKVLSFYRASEITQTSPRSNGGSKRRLFDEQDSFDILTDRQLLITSEIHDTPISSFLGKCTVSHRRCQSEKDNNDLLQYLQQYEHNYYYSKRYHKKLSKIVEEQQVDESRIQTDNLTTGIRQHIERINQEEDIRTTAKVLLARQRINHNRNQNNNDNNNNNTNANSNNNNSNQNKYTAPIDLFSITTDNLMKNINGSTNISTIQSNKRKHDIFSSTAYNKNSTTTTTDSINESDNHINYDGPATPILTIDSPANNGEEFQVMVNDEPIEELAQTTIDKVIS